MLSDPTLLSTSPVLAHSKLLGWQDGGLNSYELLHTVFIENFFPVSDLLGGVSGTVRLWFECASPKGGSLAPCMVVMRQWVL